MSTEFHSEMSLLVEVLITSIATSEDDRGIMLTMLGKMAKG